MHESLGHFFELGYPCIHRRWLSFIYLLTLIYFFVSIRIRDRKFNRIRWSCFVLNFGGIHNCGKLFIVIKLLNI